MISSFGIELLFLIIVQISSVPKCAEGEIVYLSRVILKVFGLFVFPHNGVKNRL